MNILLAVCGSISAYKSLDLARNLIKSGHNVRIILTQGAAEFVLPQTFSYLGAEKIYQAASDFKHSSNKSILHIELTQWADILLIAPLSANTLSAMAQGLCNDLLTSVCLAWDKQKPILLFSAMNTRMFEHPLIQKNLNTLKSLPWCFAHPPTEGLLACGDQGIGKLPTPELIQDFTESFSLKNARHKKILITTGATIAPLDPIRYLTNPSSGITGFHLASKALRSGHEVCLIAGRYATTRLEHLLEHPRYKLYRIETAEDLFAKVREEFPSCHAYISAAAIGDIAFESVSPKKIKKINPSRLSPHTPNPRCPGVRT